MSRRRVRSAAYRARRTARKLAKSHRQLLDNAVLTNAPDNSWDLEGNIARSLAMKP